MYCTLPHVKVGAGNGLFEFSDMRDFEGTETLGNHTLNFLENIFCSLFLI